MAGPTAMPSALVAVLAVALLSGSGAAVSPVGAAAAAESRLELSFAHRKASPTGPPVSPTPAATADRVSFLPGWGEPHFGLYSGYVSVDEEAGRALFYVMAEAMISPETAPLMLWLNGGPGCSSLGGGFLSELGPYYPRTVEGKLQSNPNSWNREATVIFLESPAFVGFSYSNTSSDSVVGDARTAADAYAFLLRLLERFPQYANRPLWLSGESYGGHYLPTLASAILVGNKKGGNPNINLKGFLVGNPWTDATIDNLGAVDFWNSHAIVSTATAEGLKEKCDFSKIGPLASTRWSTSNFPTDSANDKCDSFQMSATSEMGHINIYDIFADVCLPRQEVVARQLLGANGHSATVLLGTSSPDFEDEQKYDPCVDTEVEDYFNLPEVQVALHANVSGSLPYRWQDCTPGYRLQYSRQDLLSSMMPVYHNLLDKDIRILVYSGDVDAIVPVTGTRRWVEALQLEVTDEWRPWQSSTGQVAGWTQGFSHGLTFATVRGAGHMVPYTQPERAFDMVTKFVSGKPL